jgi:hypothetical protein
VCPGGGKLTLVAYSTPREAYAKLITEFAKTQAGKGTVRAVVRELRRAGARRPRRAQGGRRRALARAGRDDARLRELYDNPANEFVMTFVGEVNRIGSSFVRPHDVEFGEGDHALVGRVVHFGFEVRVELRLANGEELWAQTTRDEAQRLELVEGARSASGRGTPRSSASLGRVFG